MSTASPPNSSSNNGISYNKQNKHKNNKNYKNNSKTNKQLSPSPYPSPSLNTKDKPEETPNYAHILSVVARKYPALQHVKVKVEAADSHAYFGYIVMDRVGDYIYTSNKSRQRQVIPRIVHVTRNDRDKIITFLHELAHGVTPVVERKVRNEWVEVIHGHEFHQSFLEICNYCFDAGLLPKRLSEKELRMRDSVNKYQHGC